MKINTSCQCDDTWDCGSGKNYSRCCLSTQTSLDKQIQSRGGQVVHANDNELSRAIMHLAKELIEEDTKAEYDFAVGAACMAWNLDAELEIDMEIKRALEEMCHDANPEEKKEMHDLMMPIIEKKRIHYPRLDCLVTGFEVMENKGQFYLNIAYKRGTGVHNDAVH